MYGFNTNQSTNNKKVAPLPSLRPALQLPLYYISFHGLYDNTAFEEPIDYVPKNSYIFETCIPGEIVHEVIDTYLWPICNYEFREDFLNTLSMHSSEPSLTHHQHAIRQLHVHLPETPYARKKLYSQAGRKGRSFFQGIYKFDNKTPYSETLPPSSKSLYKDFMKTLIENRMYTTNEDIIRLILSNDVDAADGAIFLFVSCGSISCISPQYVDIISQFSRDKDMEFIAQHDGLSRAAVEDTNTNTNKPPTFTELDTTFYRRERNKNTCKRELASLKY